MKEVWGFIKDIAIAIVIAGILLFFIKPVVIQQESMQPNYYSDDYVIVSKQSYSLFGEIERGDVIVFKTDMQDVNGKDKNLIKRVIGLPGDTIEIKDGYVIRNGETLNEDYVAQQRISGEMAPVIVEQGKLFVLGDNRGVSQDSRSNEIGQIDQDTIIGKVVFRVFPLKRIGFCK